MYCVIFPIPRHPKLNFKRSPITKQLRARQIGVRFGEEDKDENDDLLLLPLSSAYGQKFDGARPERNITNESAQDHSIEGMFFMSINDMVNILQ